jgi:hypothetical protein
MINSHWKKYFNSNDDYKKLAQFFIEKGHDISNCSVLNNLCQELRESKFSDVSVSTYHTIINSLGNVVETYCFSSESHDIANSIFNGSAQVFPILNSTFLPDPRSGIFLILIENQYYVVTQHASRSSITFKRRLSLLSSIQSTLHNNIDLIEPVELVMFVFGWKYDFLIFKYSGNNFLDGVSQESIINKMYATIENLMDERCCIYDFAPRNILFCDKDNTLRICDMERGIYQGDDFMDEWDIVFSKNIYEFLLLELKFDNINVPLKLKLDEKYFNREVVNNFENFVCRNSKIVNNHTEMRERLWSIFMDDSMNIDSFLVLRRNIWDMISDDDLIAFFDTFISQNFVSNKLHNNFLFTSLVSHLVYYFSITPSGRNWLIENSIKDSSMCVAKKLAKLSLISSCDQALSNEDKEYVMNLSLSFFNKQIGLYDF